MSKISIIMPVFNAKKFLSRALNSLITQTYNNIEIICIDDGSTDNSDEVLFKYKNIDSRIKVISQENQGQEQARNVGLQYATGNYVMFCDADDYYEPTMCEEMLQCIQKNNVDLVGCDVFILEDESNHNRKTYGIQEIYLSSFGYYEFTDDDIPFFIGVLWNKIFKMELIKKYNITFMKDKVVSGELSFCYTYLLFSKNMFLLNRKLYNYMLNSSSIIGSCSHLKNTCYQLMLPINVVIQKIYSYNFAKKKWIYKYLEKKLQATYSLKSETIDKVNNLLQEMSKFIPEQYFDFMPFFSSCVKREVCPIFNDNPNCFVFSTNDNYIPYLAVALQSFIEHSNNTTNYDICILYHKLSNHYIQLIKTMQRDNISIRFINISAYLSEIDYNLFHVYIHFSVETYFRFFIPKIFSAYQRVCYLDCDMLFLKDLSPIFNEDIKNYFFAAVLDYKNKVNRVNDVTIADYIEKKLKMAPENYFNAGFLLLNIPKLLECNFLENCLKRLEEIKKPRCVDQCVLNSLFSNDYKQISMQWNVQLNVTEQSLKKFNFFKESLEYKNALLNPYILHYCSDKKPWNNFNVPLDYLWWKFARKSIFYEEILKKSMNK